MCMNACMYHDVCFCINMQLYLFNIQTYDMFIYIHRQVEFKLINKVGKIIQ